MADKEQTVLLEFEIDQSGAFKELEKSKRSILELKQEQAELNKLYKAGKIDIEKYSQETVRLDTKLKQQNATYQTTQKSITGVKTQLDKLIDSNKNIATSFDKTADKLSKQGAGFTSFSSSVTHATQNIRVAGVGIGDLTTKLSALANPVTATIAVLGGLATAYARSTTGAKDLKFASDELSTATTILTNNFAALITSAEDGEGAVTKLVDAILFNLSPALFAEAKAATLAQEAFEDLGRTETKIRTENNERLEENAFLLSEIAREQTTYNEKIGLSSQITNNLKNNQRDLVSVLEEQFNMLKRISDADPNNEAKQNAFLDKRREISKVETDINRKLQAQIRLEDNLREAEAKRIAGLAAETKIQNDANRRSQIGGVRSNTSTSLEGISTDLQGGSSQDKAEKAFIKSQQAGIDMRYEVAKVTADTNRQMAEDDAKYTQLYIEGQHAKTQAASDVLGAFSNLLAQGSEEQRVFALASIGIDTAEAISSLTAASEANPSNAFTFGGAAVAQFAAGLIRILTNIGAAKNYLGFAEGGYTGNGSKYEFAGHVHKGEYVTPKHIVSSPSAAPHLAALESMRTKGYADGGFVTNKNMEAVQQTQSMMNFVKNLPAPEVSVKQILTVMKQIQVKQQISGKRKAA